MPVEQFNCDSVPLSAEETDLAVKLAQVIKPNRGKHNAVHASDVIKYVQQNYGQFVTPERLRDIFQHITFTTLQPEFLVDREDDCYFVVGSAEEFKNYYSKVEGTKFFIDHHFDFLQTIKQKLDKK